MARPACAVTKQELQEEIATKRQDARDKRRELTRLTSEERKLFSELAVIEDRVFDLEDSIWEQENQLAAIKTRQEELRARHQEMMAEQAVTMRELGALLVSIWPIHMQHLEARLEGLDSWSVADRRFTWMAALYRATGEKLDKVMEQTRLLAENIKEQGLMAERAEAKLDEINRGKDDLLKDQLSLLANIKKVRALKLSQEQELGDIMGAIDSLAYKLKSLTDRRFTTMKRHLPWPADGDVVSRYAPTAKPPRKGIGLKLIEDQDIRSIFWGKVVHADQLRGFGQVVIIYHGQNYYSLYAFLSRSTVAMGQEVEKDEVIGNAGFYPKAKGPGLYFELRFRQKAINPNRWLSSRTN